MKNDSITTPLDLIKFIYTIRYYVLTGILLSFIAGIFYLYHSSYYDCQITLQPEDDWFSSTLESKTAVNKYNFLINNSPELTKFIDPNAKIVNYQSIHIGPSVETSYNETNLSYTLFFHLDKKIEVQDVHHFIATFNKLIAQRNDKVFKMYKLNFLNENPSFSKKLRMLNTYLDAEQSKEKTKLANQYLSLIAKYNLFSNKEFLKYNQATTKSLVQKDYISDLRFSDITDFLIVHRFITPEEYQNFNFIYFTSRYTLDRLVKASSLYNEYLLPTFLLDTLQIDVINRRNYEKMVEIITSFIFLGFIGSIFICLVLKYSKNILQIIKRNK